MKKGPGPRGSRDEEFLVPSLAALIGKYIENEMDKTAKKIKSATSKAIVIPLSLFHLEAPLILLPILLGISFVVFCIEYVSGK